MSGYFRQGIAFGIALVAAGLAQAQTRPPVGGVNSAPGAMIFYVAHGAPDACGPGCSDWIAAEGAVQWDTYKRLLAILDRQNGRKLPVVINVRGNSNLNVASSLGRILRDRGIDAAVAATEVEACTGKSEEECFALKRPGGPLDAKEKLSGIACDFACLLVLSGGVHRSLPQGSRVVLSGMAIHNRLAPNVSAEHRESLTSIFTDQFRRYLGEMGIDHELLDVAVSNAGGGRFVEIPASEWGRLHLVTQPQ
ncbi:MULTISPECIES: hypothetical protein [Bradyrhizobium]|jgi:hypothetical protein|uniref:hypothetical protein n=1 Tax=Bradyrhizobium TaxID=374 RepID=UPI000486CC5E|nr:MULTISPECIES: hypothetical protein [Bradyrhizobium]MCS3450153.1 hypothetical protein [Bradyrhizobium elkanii]MCS3558703.1 hypothetical protein [Bradyrhizobium elkanii]MCW2151450.1 hypothetical protein [Bradyrhizobium elkanii]MCW2358677.1 hypothetical protein [Bradyrhizobium elkanii]MCW2375181.1 hypothetical protein [Bradyrhizobium elkanii]